MHKIQQFKQERKESLIVHILHIQTNRKSKLESVKQTIATYLTTVSTSLSPKVIAELQAETIPFSVELDVAINACQTSIDDLIKYRLV